MLPLMRKAGSGSIINFGSYDGFIADPGLAAYCASKGAVHALTRAMACDYGPENIRVNAIACGLIKSNMTAAMLDIPELIQPHLDRTPMSRLGEPADIAGPTLFLTSPAAAYITGQTLNVDGGFSVQG